MQAVAVTLVIARFFQKERAGIIIFRRERYSYIAIFDVSYRKYASLDLGMEILEGLDLEGTLPGSLDAFCRSLCRSHGRDVRNMLLDGILTDVGVIVCRSLACRSIDDEIDISVGDHVADVGSALVELLDLLGLDACLGDHLVCSQGR